LSEKLRGSEVTESLVGTDGVVGAFPGEELAISRDVGRPLRSPSGLPPTLAHKQNYQEEV